VPAELFRASDRQAFDQALAELLASHMAMADMPSAQANLGVLLTAGAARPGQPFMTASDGSVLCQRGSTWRRSSTGWGRNADAERTLRAAFLTPASGELRYHSVSCSSRPGGRCAGELQTAAGLRVERVSLQPRLPEQPGAAKAEAALRRATRSIGGLEIVYACCLLSPVGR
jgi:hypothetical protein